MYKSKPNNNTQPQWNDVSAELLPCLIDQGISALLPSHITPEQFAHSAAIAMATNQDLLIADKQSVVMSLLFAAKDGLLCDGREAALVVFKRKNGNVWEKYAQYMPMVEGVIKRMVNSGIVIALNAHAIYAADKFEYWNDEKGEHFKHVPAAKDRGEIIAAIAYAKLTGGETVARYLTLDEIDRARNASSAHKAAIKFGKQSMWDLHEAEMVCKTAIHRLSKKIPRSSEIVRLIERADGERVELDITPKKQYQRPHGQLLSELMSKVKNAGDMQFLTFVGKEIAHYAQINELSEPEVFDLRAEFAATKKQLALLEDRQ